MKANVAFLLLVIAGQTPKAAAQAVGTFTATGNMTMPRAGHTATLLSPLTSFRDIVEEWQRGFARSAVIVNRHEHILPLCKNVEAPRRSWEASSCGLEFGLSSG